MQPFPPISPDVRRTLLRGLVGVLVVGMVAVAGFLGLVASRDLDSMARQVLESGRASASGTLEVGRTRTRFWPNPRILLDRVQFRSADGRFAVTAGRAVIDIGMFDLIDGRIDAPNIRLLGAKVEAISGPIQNFYQASRRGI